MKKNANTAVPRQDASRNEMTGQAPATVGGGLNHSGSVVGSMSSLGLKAPWGWPVGLR